MKLSLFIPLIVSLSAAPLATATTVSIGASVGAGSRLVTLQNQTTLVGGGVQILVGSFNNTNFTLGSDTIANDWAAIQTAGQWSQFDTGVSTNTSSKITGTATDNTATASPFNGKTIYMVIFNTSGGPSTATQMGIFQATTATPSWVFPTNLFGAPGDSTGSLSTIDPANKFQAVGTTPIGSVDATHFYLAAPTAVPEPTTFALGAMIGFAGLGMRRRQRR